MTSRIHLVLWSFLVLWHLIFLRCRRHTCEIARQRYLPSKKMIRSESAKGAKLSLKNKSSPEHAAWSSQNLQEHERCDCLSFFHHCPFFLSRKHLLTPLRVLFQKHWPYIFCILWLRIQKRFWFMFHFFKISTIYWLLGWNSSLPQLYWHPTVFMNTCSIIYRPKLLKQKSGHVVGQSGVYLRGKNS